MSPELKAWVRAKAPIPIEAVEPLRAEASSRRFYRIRGNRASWVVMNSPPALERNADFVARQRLFARHGLPVPRILAHDSAAGYFLLSDLGSRDLAAAYSAPDRAQALEAAISHLVRLQAISAEGVPPYTEKRLTDEIGVFVEWFLGALLQQEAPRSADSVFATLVQVAIDQPQCLIHRDYHSRNLLFSEDGHFGIVDFQDALIGPMAYDLASLLRDCYYHFDLAEIRHWQGRFRALAAWPLAAEQLSRILDLTALQRQFKAIGIFSRLWLRDGKASHLRHIRPVLGAMIDIAGCHPETRKLRAWLQGLAEQAPAALRRSQAR